MILGLPQWMSRSWGGGNLAALHGFDSFERWPVHVFYNYLAPNYLEQLGYTHAVKLDYDVLCVQEYDKAIFPAVDEIISILYKDCLSSYVKSVNWEFSRLDLNNNYSVNAGVIFINLKSYKQFSFFRKFQDIYIALNKSENSKNVQGEFLEQFALGLLQPQWDIRYKPLESGYNFRPYFSKSPKDIFNIHFNSPIKPWQPFQLEKLKQKPAGWFRVWFYFNRWINYAIELGVINHLNLISNYSDFQLMRGFDDVISRFETNLLLQRYAIEIYRHQVLPRSFKFVLRKEFIQFLLNEGSGLHYEISIRKGKCVLSFHLEGRWRRFFPIVHQLFKGSSTFSLNPKGGELSITINNKNDISKVKNEFSFLYRKTRLLFKIIMILGFLDEKTQRL